MNLDHYLQRIGYDGTPAVTRDTLDGLITAHVNAVTFENLNQQLGQPVTLDMAGIYQKVVMQQRGGWCFELNSLFGWALTELGFDVEYLAGQVGRSEGAPEFLTNHMLLRVRLDQPLLVDVGYGCGLARSIPLSPNEEIQIPYDVSVSELNDGFFVTASAVEVSRVLMISRLILLIAPISRRPAIDCRRIRTRRFCGL